MEGVKVFTNDEWVEAGLSSVNYVEKDLKEALEGLARHLFGEVQLKSPQAAFQFVFSGHISRVRALSDTEAMHLPFEGTTL
jgi:hypothetical protein